ncbi:HNH endonuclease signature motif containing protein [Pseudoxanthomonas mexicana]
MRIPRDAKGRFRAAGDYAVDPDEGVVYGKRGQPIKSVSRLGYIQIMHGGRRVLAHRFIWEAVNGPIPDGLTVNHINGIKTDNRIANLELLTVAGNLEHARELGLLDTRGEAHGKSKLTDEAVMFIRRHRGQYTLQELADKFGVSKVAVSQAGTGKRWRHLPME